MQHEVTNADPLLNLTEVLPPRPRYPSAQARGLVHVPPAPGAVERYEPNTHGLDPYGSPDTTNPLVETRVDVEDLVPTVGGLAVRDHLRAQGVSGQWNTFNAKVPRPEVTRFHGIAPAPKVAYVKARGVARVPQRPHVVPNVASPRASVGRHRAQ